LTYSDLIAVGARDLAPDEWWVIDHDEGTLWDTASKAFDRPVVIICQALNCDWDDAVESSFRLAKMRKP